MFDTHSHSTMTPVGDLTAAELDVSKGLLETKHVSLKELTKLHLDKVPRWREMDRTPTLSGGNDIISVYKMSTARQLTRKQLRAASRLESKGSTDGRPMSHSTIEFLDQGIQIEHLQCVN